MATYNTIVVKEKGASHHIEGTLAAETPSPGMAMQLNSSGTYQMFNGAANGEMDEVILLKEDALQGKTVDDAYASAAHAFMFIPQSGDECLVLIKDGEAIAVGDKLIREDATGLWIETTGSPEEEDFKALEASSPSGSNALVWARRI